jgi:hypothetical protein
MTLDQAILTAMVEATYKDHIISETMYHRMMNAVMTDASLKEQPKSTGSIEQEKR